MYELHNYRPGYAIVAPPRPHGGWVTDAHRAVRNTVAIAGILNSIPSEDFFAASDAVVAAENNQRYAPAEAAAVAKLCRSVATALQVSIDRNGQPVVGGDGDRIREEAELSQVDERGVVILDRVFALDAEGRVGLANSRMGLSDLRDMLPEVAALLERAAAGGHDVELVDYEPEADDPFALHL